MPCDTCQLVTQTLRTLQAAAQVALHERNLWMSYSPPKDAYLLPPETRAVLETALAAATAVLEDLPCSPDVPS